MVSWHFCIKMTQGKYTTHNMKPILSISYMIILPQSFSHVCTFLVYIYFPQYQTKQLEHSKNVKQNRTGSESFVTFFCILLTATTKFYFWNWNWDLCSASFQFWDFPREVVPQLLRKLVHIFFQNIKYHFNFGGAKQYQNVAKLQNIMSRIVLKFLFWSICLK